MDVVWQIVKCSPSSSGLLEKTLTFCWEIWKTRNLVRHGGTHRSGKAIVQKSQSLVEEYKAATEIVHPPPAPPKKKNPQKQ